MRYLLAVALVAGMVLGCSEDPASPGGHVRTLTVQALSDGWFVTELDSIWDVVSYVSVMVHTDDRQLTSRQVVTSLPATIEWLSTGADDSVYAAYCFIVDKDGPASAPPDDRFRPLVDSAGAWMVIDYELYPENDLLTIF